MARGDTTGPIVQVRRRVRARAEQIFDLCADSDEVAQAFRDGVARRSDMMPPGSGASLADDLCHSVLGWSIAGDIERAACPRVGGEWVGKPRASAPQVAL